MRIAPRLLAALSILAIGPILLAGCGGGGGEAPGADEPVRFWHAMGGPLGKSLGSLVTDYSASGTEVGTRCNMRSWVTKSSAWAPPPTMPMTSSPTDHPTTASPSAAMRPEYSSPGTSNSGCFPGAG